MLTISVVMEVKHRGRQAVYQEAKQKFGKGVRTRKRGLGEVESVWGFFAKMGRGKLQMQRE